MTRQERAAIKEAKRQAKIALKMEKRQDKQELKAWEQMKARAKALGAWIEGSDIEVNQFSN